MYATKETWVIASGCLAVALLLALPTRRSRAALTVGDSTWRGRHVVAALVMAVAVSSVFFSSFLTNPGGVVDGVMAYRTYFERAVGPASWHVHPWHYYLGLLLYSPSRGGPVWTEGAIVAFALIGVVAAARDRRETTPLRRRFLVFFGLYTVMMVAVYSAIPYKTPWCLLGFLHGLILLAGVGVARVVGGAPTALLRFVAVLVVAAASGHLGWLAWMGSFRYPADPRNPYVYAHTGVDVFEIARRVEGLALTHPEGAAMPIEIVSRENLWPLPWYLRRLSNVRWETAPPEDAVAAPVFLLTPEAEAAVVRRLYELRPPDQRELYVNIFDAPVDLRPQVEVRGYAAKTLWDEYRQRSASTREADR
jgi:predicted membrane-bound mannosyltransferase